MVFIHEMADGLTLRAQDKRGALATSPTIVILIGKHGVFHSSLILIPDVDDPVGVVSEEPLAPPVVLLPVFFLGRCCIILHRGWIVIAVLLGACEAGSSSSPSVPPLSLLPSDPPALVADGSSSSSCQLPSDSHGGWLLFVLRRGLIAGIPPPSGSHSPYLSFPAALFLR